MAVVQSTAERWLAVVGWEGLYEVSDLGRVRRVKQGRGAKAGAILRQSRKGKYFGLTLTREGRPSQYYTHRLVILAFVGPIPEGSNVNHKDGDRHNNRLSNLEILTFKENTRHAVESGLWKNRGADNPVAVVTADMVADVRNTYRPGRSADSAGRRVSDLALKHDVSEQTIRRILARQTFLD